MTYLGDTNDHVFDERFKGIDRASLFVASKPHADSDEGAGSLLLFQVHFLELDREVTEVLLNFSSWSLHSNDSCLHVNGD